MTQRSGLSHTTVSYGRRAFGLQPRVRPPDNITETFKLSANPLFIADISWTFRISSGVSQGIDKSVVQSDREFLNVGVGGRR